MPRDTFWHNSILPLGVILEDKTKLFFLEILKSLLSSILFSLIVLFAGACFISHKFPPDWQKVKTLTAKSLELLKKSEEFIANLDDTQIEGIKKSLDFSRVNEQIEAQQKFMKDFQQLQIDILTLKEEVRLLKASQQISRMPNSNQNPNPNPNASLSESSTQAQTTPSPGTSIQIQSPPASRPSAQIQTPPPSRQRVIIQNQVLHGK